MTKATTHLTDLEIAHNGLIARLEQEIPNRTSPAATPAQLEARSQHLREVLNAAVTYSRAVMADCKYVTTVGLDTDCDDLVYEVTKLCARLTNAAVRLEDEVTYA